MEEFKKIFTKMATEYAGYVESKIKAQKEMKTDADRTDNAKNEAFELMNEVRTANAVAATLTRMTEESVV